MSEPTPPSAPDADALLALVLTTAGEVFGHQVVATDDFFALGGDSVAAVELATSLEERLDLDVDSRLIFSTDSIGGLARHLLRAAGETAAAADRGPAVGEDR
ncbi:acyl carrier protein [Streptomyces sp. NPDC093990]|uniref:acyl carrier protein n=1 Tax=Streptomyces sp. NPDC093990 TaxID=3155306 RepID=UPI003420ACFC